MTLGASIARRIATALVTLFAVTLLVFLCGASLPGADDPDESARRLPPGYAAALRSQLHLDEPVASRYARWMSDLVRGDLGTSFREHRPVAEVVRQRLPVSLSLNALALLVMLAAAIPLGLAGAWRPSSLGDRAVILGTSALYAVPVFWAALVLQRIFASRLGWLPLYGISTAGASSGALGALGDRLAHLVLPAACLAYPGLAYVARFVRSAVLEGSSGEAGRVARARGVGAARFLVGHGLPQAAVPLLTLAGFLVPRLVGGSLLVEAIFNVPGLGSLMWDSVLARDLPVILGLTLLSGTTTLAAITAADVLAAWCDPRVRRAA